MRNIAGSPNTCALRQGVVHTANLEKKFAGQNVIPLVFAMMDVQRRPRAREDAHLEDRTRASALVTRQLARRSLRLLSVCEREQALTGFCGDHFSPRRRIGKGEQRSNRKT